MKDVTIRIDNCLYDFYQKVGQSAGAIEPEKVMVDALFQLASELSLGALEKRKNEADGTQEGGAFHKERPAFLCLFLYCDVHGRPRQKGAVVLQQILCHRVIEKAAQFIGVGSLG